MEPKIVTKDAFRVVGMRYVGKNEHGEISQMWGEFVPRSREIRHGVGAGAGAYGLCYCPGDAEPGVIEYVAGVPAAALKDIPEGMTGREVPTQTYAVFEAPGLAGIHRTYDYILKEWLPKSSYQAGDGPDFEYYDESFNPDDPKSTIYIYFPIKSKA